MLTRTDTTPRRAGQSLWWHLRSAFLDGQLASGAPPAWSHAIEARARQITTPEHCEELTRDWERLLDRCRHSPAALSFRAPLCRDRILAAEPDIRSLLAALNEATTDSARGVAMSAVLLSDGTGPLYNSASTVDLADLIRDAISNIVF